MRSTRSWCTAALASRDPLDVGGEVGWGRVPRPPDRVRSRPSGTDVDQHLHVVVDLATAQPVRAASTDRPRAAAGPWPSHVRRVVPVEDVEGLSPERSESQNAWVLPPLPPLLHAEPSIAASTSVAATATLIGSVSHPLGMVRCHGGRGHTRPTPRTPRRPRFVPAGSRRSCADEVVGRQARRPARTCHRRRSVRDGGSLTIRRRLAMTGASVALDTLVLPGLAARLAGQRLATDGRRTAQPLQARRVARARSRARTGAPHGRCRSSGNGRRAATHVRRPATTRRGRARAARGLGLARGRGRRPVSLVPAGRQGLARRSRRHRARRRRARRPRRGVDEVGAVVLYLPRRLEAADVTRCSGRIREHHVLHAVIGVTGRRTADEPQPSSRSSTRRPASESSRQRCRQRATCPRSIPRLASTIVRAADPGEEAASPPGRVVERISPRRRRSTAWPIVSRVQSPYTLLVHEELAAAGIPHSAPAAMQLCQSITGRVLLGFLQWPSNGHRRDDLMRVLRGAPVRDPAGGRARPDRWDRVARDAGVVLGLDQWRQRLGAARDEAVERTVRAGGAHGEPGALTLPLATGNDDQTTGTESAGRSRRPPTACQRARRAAGLRRAPGERQRSRRQADVERPQSLGPAAAPPLPRQAMESLPVGPTVSSDPEPRSSSCSKGWRPSTRSNRCRAAIVPSCGRARAVEARGSRRHLRSGRVRRSTVRGHRRRSRRGHRPRLFRRFAPASRRRRSAVARPRSTPAGPALRRRGMTAGEEERDVLAVMAVARDACTLTFPVADPREQRTRQPAPFVLEQCSSLLGERVDTDDVTRLRDDDRASSWFVDLPSFEWWLAGGGAPATPTELDVSELVACACRSPAARPAPGRRRGRAPSRTRGGHGADHGRVRRVVRVGRTLGRAGGRPPTSALGDVVAAVGNVSVPVLPQPRARSRWPRGSGRGRDHQPGGSGDPGARRARAVLPLAHRRRARAPSTTSLLTWKPTSARKAERVDRCCGTPNGERCVATCTTSSPSATPSSGSPASSRWPSNTGSASPIPMTTSRSSRSWSTSATTDRCASAAWSIASTARPTAAGSSSSTTRPDRPRGMRCSTGGTPNTTSWRGARCCSCPIYAAAARAAYPDAADVDAYYWFIGQRGVIQMLGGPIDAAARDRFGVVMRTIAQTASKRACSRRGPATRSGDRRSARRITTAPTARTTGSVRRVEASSGSRCASATSSATTSSSRKRVTVADDVVGAGRRAMSTLAAESPLLEVDHDSRARIRDDLHRNLFVEAGAGTGKTRVLVDRVVRLVATGTVREIGNLVAITFTEAAAAELRDRVATSARARGGRSPAAGRRARPVRSRPRAARHRHDHDAARVRAPSAGRVPARRGPAAGVRGRRRRAGAGSVQRTMEAIPRRAVRRLHVRSRPADRRTRCELRPTASATSPSSCTIDGIGSSRSISPVPPLPEVDPAPIVAAIDEAVRVAAGTVQTSKATPLARWSGGGFSCETCSTTGVQAGDELEVVHVLAGQERLNSPGNLGKREVWGDAKAPTIKALSSAVEATTSLLHGLRTAVIERLMPRLASFTLDGVDQRKRDGRLEFHDLLVHARDLLRSNAAVRTALSSADRCHPHRRVPGHRSAAARHRVRPGGRRSRRGSTAVGRGDRCSRARSLLVGDPKQSIYRLPRRRHLAVGPHEAPVPRRGRTPRPELPNDRTVARVGEPRVPCRDRRRCRRRATARTRTSPRSDPTSATHPQSWWSVRASPEARAIEFREQEAEDLARLIVTMKVEAWPVFDERLTDGWRPTRFDDIAILVPTRTPLRQLERSLDRLDVPVSHRESFAGLGDRRRT